MEVYGLPLSPLLIVSRSGGLSILIVLMKARTD